MDKFVINIGRQLGSGGKAVGELLARRLGIRMYDKQLIALAADQSGIRPEHFEKADEKESRGMLSSLVYYLRAPFCGDNATVANVLSNDALFKIQSDILRDHPRAVNVFISADEEDRIERLCRLHGITPEEARTRMRRTDASRADYYNYYSSRTWGEAASYHLCVNSSTLGGEEGTADFILEFASRKLKTRF